MGARVQLRHRGRQQPDERVDVHGTRAATGSTGHQQPSEVLRCRPQGIQGV